MDFKGEQRDSRASVTDAESRLLRKGPGKEAKLTFAAHALVDDRHGLITDLSVTPSGGGPNLRRAGVARPAAQEAPSPKQRRWQQVVPHPGLRCRPQGTRNQAACGAHGCPYDAGPG